MDDTKKKMPLFSGGKNKIWMLSLGFIIGILLIIWGSASAEKEEQIQPSDEPGEEKYYSEILEEKLTAFLESVNGIDSVEVLVTVDGGSEYKYAGKGGGEGYASDYLVINNGENEEPVVVQEIYPKIRGVAVVCTGGNSSAVKEQVTSLLSTALGISSNKIEVAGNDGNIRS